jgi:hypothetical protein
MDLLLHAFVQFKRTSFAILSVAVTIGALGASALPASAVEHRDSTPPTGYTVHSFAAVGAESKPDDISRLGDHVFVAFQNGVGSLGEASPSGVTSSTIQEYGLDGRPGTSWQVTGKVDGLTADNTHHRLLITTNEDGNSHFSTLSPDDEHAVKTYDYAGLTHGGGTDAISLVHGRIVITASAPTNATGPALYSVSLDGTTATLTPLFADNAPATAANGANAGHSVNLALTDPDSNTMVPRTASRFAGDFMLTAQGDQQLVFASRAEPSTKLHVLTVAQPMDDTVFAGRPEQTLWITDPTHNTIDAVTGPFSAGQAISSVTPDAGPAYLATLNLTDGTLNPINGLAAIEPKGLLITSNNTEHTQDTDNN